MTIPTIRGDDAMMTNLDHVIHLRRGLCIHGYRPVACNGKEATGFRWQHMELAPNVAAVYTRQYPDHLNTGLICGSLVGLDLDTPDREAAAAITAMATELPDFAYAPYRIGKAPKCLYAFRTTEPRPKRSTGAYLIRGLKCQIEVLGERNQFVGFGLHPDTRQPYTWHNGSPAETPLADLPVADWDAIDALLARAEAYFAANGTLMKKASVPANAGAVREAGDHPWSQVNATALANLAAWVEQLGLEDQVAYQSGFRSVASFRPSNSTTVKKRGRSLNIQPNGIVDYSAGNHGYTPIDLVAACLTMPESEAVEWLRERVGGGDVAPVINVSGLLAQPARRAARAKATAQPPAA